MSLNVFVCVSRVQIVFQGSFDPIGYGVSDQGLRIGGSVGP